MKTTYLSALLTPDEAAERLRIKRRTLIGWLEQGKLPGVKAGGHWRIRLSDLNKYLYQQGQLTPRDSSELWKEADALHTRWWQLKRELAQVETRLADLWREVESDPAPERMHTVTLHFGEDRHKLSLEEWLRSTIPVSNVLRKEEVEQRQEEDRWTVPQVARYCGVSEQTVRLWIKEGRINAIKSGRSWYIPPEEVGKLDQH